MQRLRAGKSKAAAQPNGGAGFLLVLLLGLLFLSQHGIVPGAKALHLSIVGLDRQAETTPTENLLLNNVAYWDTLRAKGHKFIRFDADSKEGASYKAAAEKVGLPTLFVFDADNKSNPSFPVVQRMPADTAGVDAVVKQLTGK